MFSVAKPTAVMRSSSITRPRTAPSGRAVSNRFAFGSSMRGSIAPYWNSGTLLDFADRSLSRSFMLNNFATKAKPTPSVAGKAKTPSASSTPKPDSKTTVQTVGKVVVGKQPPVVKVVKDKEDKIVSKAHKESKPVAETPTKTTKKEAKPAKEGKQKDTETAKSQSKGKEKEKKLKEKEAKSKSKEAAAKAKEDKRKEREKAEAKPRKAKTSFNLFFKAQYDAAKKQAGEKPAGEKSAVSGIAKIIGQKWAAATPADKKKYETLAEKDKERFQKEMKAYSLTLPPKRALSSFMVFSKKERLKLQEEQPQLSLPSVSKILGDRWATLTPEQRAPFEKEAKKLKDQYAEKVEKFNTSKE